MKKVEQLLRVSTWLFYDNVVRKTAALETFTTVNFFHPTITQWEKNIHQQKIWIIGFSIDKVKLIANRFVSNNMKNEN